MRGDLILQELSKEPVLVKESTAMSILTILANGVGVATTTQVANDSVTYEKVGKVAVISVDGVMYKKSMGGLCGDVAAYSDIIRAIDKAEADDSVNTLLFRVDTPGGSVAGLEEVWSRITACKKKTVTAYENLGASAGIYAFTASDKVYATSKNTELGSIGVVAGYVLPDENGKKVVEIVSSRAPNKRCALGEDCKAKLQAKIDVLENVFFERVQMNTGFTATQIQETFNHGDTIFADKALEAGFIDGIIPFKNILDSLQTGGAINTAMPAVVSTEKLAYQATKGENTMEFSKENFDALLASHEALTAGNASLTEENKVLRAHGETMRARNTDLAKSLDEANAALAKASEGKIEAAVAISRVQEAFAVGASVDTVVAMIKAESAESASKIALDSKPTQALTPQEQGATVSDQAAKLAEAVAKAHSVGKGAF